VGLFKRIRAWIARLSTRPESIRAILSVLTEAKVRRFEGAGIVVEFAPPPADAGTGTVADPARAQAARLVSLLQRAA
jgi:hypothetical protein